MREDEFPYGIRGFSIFLCEQGFPTSLVTLKTIKLIGTSDDI